VIDMDILSVIRRWRFRQKMPIREIKRRSGLSRADSDDAGHLFRSDPGHHSDLIPAGRSQIAIA